MQKSTTALKHPACAAGRFEVATLGPETTEVSTDAQNKEERPQLPTFYLHGRFAAETKRLVTSEAKTSKNRLRASKNTFRHGKIQKLFLVLFFYPKTLLRPRGIVRICFG